MALLTVTMTDAIEGQNARIYIANVAKHDINTDVEFIIEHLPYRQGDRILDVGYGTGRLLLRVAELGQNFSLSGIEKSQTLYTWSRNELAAANVKIANQDFTECVGYERYDIIIMSFFLHHVGHLASTLDRARQQLSSSGKIVIYDRILLETHDKKAFNHYWDTFYADDHEWDEDRPMIFSLAELIQAANALGFTVVTCRQAPHDQKPGTSRFPKFFVVLDAGGVFDD